MDGDPVGGVIDGNFAVFGEKECVEGFGDGGGEVSIEFDDEGV